MMISISMRLSHIFLLFAVRNILNWNYSWRIVSHFCEFVFSRHPVWRVLVKCWSSPGLDSRYAHYFHFNYDNKYSMRVYISYAVKSSARVHISGTGLARSLIAINHCQNSATRRTTRAAGYHHQSRVLRDQRDEGSTGTGEETEWDMEPVRYFRKLGPTIPVTFTRIHRITNTNSEPTRI